MGCLNLLKRILLNFRYYLRVEIKEKQLWPKCQAEILVIWKFTNKLGQYKIVSCLQRCQTVMGWMVFIGKEGELESSKSSSICGLFRSQLINSMETERCKRLKVVIAMNQIVRWQETRCESTGVITKTMLTVNEDRCHSIKGNRHLELKRMQWS